MADLRYVVVGRRADRDAALRAAGPQNIAALDVEVGNLGDHLLAVAAHHQRVTVLALHLERLGRLATTKQPGDLLSPLGRLTHCGQQRGHRLGPQPPPENLDRVASLDRLRLLPIAQHLDRHAGAGLQLQQLDHRPRADLARLVQHQHSVPVSVEVTGLDHLQ